MKFMVIRLDLLVLRTMNKKIKDKISSYKWYWKLLISIPITFIGLFVFYIFVFFLTGNTEKSFFDYLKDELSRDFIPFFIILILVNLPFFLNEKR